MPKKYAKIKRYNIRAEHHLTLTILLNKKAALEKMKNVHLWKKREKGKRKKIAKVKGLEIFIFLGYKLYKISRGGLPLHSLSSGPPQIYAPPGEKNQYQRPIRGTIKPTVGAT